MAYGFNVFDVKLNTLFVLVAKCECCPVITVNIFETDHLEAEQSGKFKFIISHIHKTY